MEQAPRHLRGQLADDEQRRRVERRHDRRAARRAVTRDEVAQDRGQQRRGRGLRGRRASSSEASRSMFTPMPVGQGGEHGVQVDIPRAVGAPGPSRSATQLPVVQGRAVSDDEQVVGRGRGRRTRPSADPLLDGGEDRVEGVLGVARRPCRVPTRGGRAPWVVRRRLSSSRSPRRPSVCRACDLQGVCRHSAILGHRLREFLVGMGYQGLGESAVNVVNKVPMPLRRKAYVVLPAPVWRSAK